MKNSECRRLLEKRYGKGCFMERAGIRKITPEEEEKMKRTIKGFKRLDRRMTYHHIKEKSRGGKATIENGANLAAYNHQWLHQQPEDVKDEINERLQAFKFEIDTAILQAKENGVEVEGSQEIQIDFGDTFDIPVYDVPKDRRKKKAGEFNRAKVKRETQKIVDEEFNR